jgi:acyl-coenzyme A synthetase/AMP-(fatty) acid ligase
MKRCVIISKEPSTWIEQFKDFSIMVLNPLAPISYNHYLLENSDYSLLITDNEIKERNGKDYPGEKLFLYTSGTTGYSKFYSFTKEQRDIMSKTICEAYSLTKNDRYFGVMPLWHAHGQLMYWAVKHAGCESKFGSIKSHADRDLIEKFQPTFLSSIPDMMSVLMKLNLKNLRFVRTASSALSNLLYHQLKEKWGVPVIEAFGMTESLSHCFTNPLNGEHRIGTVGKPNGIEARIEQGHLLIKGPCVFTSNWYDTGDLAEQDEKGYFRLLGRHIDQINVLGMKINPLVVENYLLNQFTEIKSCAVFGDKKLKCLIQGEVDLLEVKNFLIGLGEHHRPSVLEIIDVIPKNSSGKISRKQLESLF